MASTSDNSRTISPTQKAEKASQRLISRLYGHFSGFLQNFFKSGIKKKEYSNIDALNIPPPTSEQFKGSFAYWCYQCSIIDGSSNKEILHFLLHSEKLLQIWHDQKRQQTDLLKSKSVSASNM